MKKIKKISSFLFALVMVLTLAPLASSAAETKTVTANLFVPKAFNSQLVDTTAYLTDGTNPLGKDNYPVGYPTTPAVNNATLIIDDNGKKTVVLDVLNPVFTLQEIGGASNATVVNTVRNNESYGTIFNRVNGRITQITVELLDESGTYVFNESREFPTILGVYWNVPLTLQVDVTK